MEKQPAFINYFFKGGYVELFNTIRASFRKLGQNVADAWHAVVDNFLDFWETFWPTIGGIISFSLDWSDLFTAIASICKLSFFVGKLLCVLVFTTGLCLLFSALHICVLVPIMLGAYLAFFFLRCTDTIYRQIHKISSNCPNCQGHFALPHYICPNCGAVHTALIPSRYGIWKRTCQCGEKLPTTFFNGREKLPCRCPNPQCACKIEDGGCHVDICIPVVGGKNSGKTCLIHSALSQIEQVASGYGLEYRYSPSGVDDYETNVAGMRRGVLPDKTFDMRMKYYQFYLTPPDAAVKNLISVCDVAGEVYADSASLGEQIGYRYANAFMLVVDPLAITDYRQEVSQRINPAAYGYSDDSIDAIVSMLTTTLENMCGISSGEMIKTDVAVVLTKCDIPGLQEKVGEPALREYMQNHPGVSRFAAQNAVCEKFLIDYNEMNFINSLRSKFRTVQFFCCSALGHNADGTPFVATGVEEPVLWLVDRAVDNIDLKKQLGQPAEV